MELSLLCDVKVFMFLYDKKSSNKLLHFQSDQDDDFVSYLFKDCCNPRNFYCNDNVSILIDKFYTYFKRERINE